MVRKPLIFPDNQGGLSFYTHPPGVCLVAAAPANQATGGLPGFSLWIWFMLLENSAARGYGVRYKGCFATTSQG
jgi:hypothetical protein